jgi:site-specific DNA recombinase
MMPTYTVRDARRYRYYATRTAASGVRGVEGRLRLPAAPIEALVMEQLAAWLEATQPGTNLDPLTAEAAMAKAQWQADLLRNDLQYEQRALLLELRAQVAVKADTVGIAFTPPNAEQPVQIEVPAKLVDRGSDLRLAIGPGGQTTHTSADPVLLKLVALGAAAREQLTSGKSDTLVDGYSRQHLTRLARLGYLAPDIVSAIVEGRQPPSLNGRRLLRFANLPIDWCDQRRVLGFA